MTPLTDPVLGADPVLDIAHEVFTALVDGGETSLVRSDRPWQPDDDVVHAWVDMRGAVNGRAVLRCGVGTARELGRALLGMGPDEEVTREDFVDAVGEVANVVGGNLKSILAESGTLGLPQVSAEPPEEAGASLLHDLVLDWRGHQLGIAVWLLA